MAPPVDRLFTMAQAVLDAIVDNWPDECDDLPERRFVANGTIIWDGCEQLAVSAPRTANALEGDPATEAIVSTPAFVGLQYGVFDITLLRCVPDLADDGGELTMPTVPTPEELTTSASQILRDEGGVRNAVILAQRRGNLATCSGLVIEGWAAAGPEGTMGGGNTRIRLSLI